MIPSFVLYFPPIYKDRSSGRSGGFDIVSRFPRIRLFLKKYGHIWTMAYFLIYLPWFFFLEDHVTRSYHVMYTPFDDMIPFCEYFIVPYLLWFFYIAAAFLYFFFTNRRDYYRLCAFLFSGMTISLIICTLFPNGTTFRPSIDPNANIFCYMVSKLWAIDTSSNVFPSIHVFNSLGVHIALSKSETLSKRRGIICGSGILMTLICISTVCLKQHSILDVLGSLLLALLLYPFVYVPSGALRQKYARRRIRRT